MLIKRSFKWRNTLPALSPESLEGFTWEISPLRAIETRLTCAAQQAGFAPAAPLTCAKDAAADVQRPHRKLWVHPPPRRFNVSFVIKECMSSPGFTCFILGAEHMIKARFSHSCGDLVSLLRLNSATDAVQGLGDEAKNRLYNPSRCRICVPTVNN